MHNATYNKHRSIRSVSVLLRPITNINVHINLRTSLATVNLLCHKINCKVWQLSSDWFYLRNSKINEMNAAIKRIPYIN